MKLISKETKIYTDLFIKIVKDINPNLGLIFEERLNHFHREGFFFEHDDKHIYDELAVAASHYAKPDTYRNYYVLSGKKIPVGWPWEKSWWKPTPDNRKRELIKAGALILAELDRLDRLEKSKNKKDETRK